MNAQAGVSDSLAARRERAHEIVVRHGWNSTAYQILNPGIDYWFAPDGEAVVGYVDRGGVRVVAGAPVCARSRLAAAALQLENESSAAGLKVCYFCAGHRLRSVLGGGPPHRAVLIGAQPSWPPSRWSEMLASHESLRAQLNRAHNKGVTVRSVNPGEAAHDPQLHRCLQEWLGTRGLPPLHFLVETRALDAPYERRVYVAERAGEALAFLVASPVPARQGWLAEQAVRGSAAPNGTIELLIDAAVRDAAAGGDRYFTLGLSPLSDRAGPAGDGGPLWLRFLLGWMRAHARRFYDFQGLEHFKAKFRPARWEPIFAISSGPSFTPGMLYAVADAFSDRSVASTLARALASAARQELRWAGHRLPPRHTSRGAGH